MSVAFARASWRAKCLLTNIVPNKHTVCARCLRTSAPVLGVRPLWRSKWIREVYRRRAEISPEPEVPRFQQPNWNYDSEIYSFGKRLGEEFNENLLRTAFVDRSDVESADSNEELASTGSKLAVTYIKAYLRHAYPGLPEEGISTITEHLMSDQVLSYVASNLGVPDLIKAENWPFSEEVIANSFKAVIGALAESQNVSRAELFVQDLVLTQLIGRDLFELWDIVNPVGLIQSIFNKQGRGELEPRLLWEAGSDTVVSSYMIGFYENKKLIGKGFGESVPIAEEMAARDALRNVFGLKLNRPALPFGKEGRNLNLDLTKLNASMAQISSSPQQQLN